MLTGASSNNQPNNSGAKENNKVKALTNLIVRLLVDQIKGNKDERIRIIRSSPSFFTFSNNLCSF